MNDILMLSNAVDVSSIPDTINILPFGNVRSQKGDFVVDDESYRLIYNAFKERHIDIVIDYEHQTLKDTEAPAGGWIKDILLGEEGILAKVEWTSKAKEYLKNKEYRYLSPVIMTRRSDRKAISLHSVALTNAPAIDGMKPIINSLNGGDSSKMPEDTVKTDDNAAAISDLGNSSNLAEFMGKLKELLSLEQESSPADILKRIKELLENSSNASKELNSLKYNLQKQDVEDVIENALKQGKISSAMRPIAEKMACKDLEVFKDFIANSAPVVPMGKMNLQDAPASGRYRNSRASELLRVSEEDYKKYGE